MSNYITITVQTEVDAKKFASSILGSCFSTWEWYSDVVYVDGYDWDTVPDDPTEKFIRIEIDDPNDDALYIEKALSVTDLKVSYEAVAKSSHIDWEDIDADVGDRIIQHAVLGEIVYG